MFTVAVDGVPTAYPVPADSVSTTVSVLSATLSFSGVTGTFTVSDVARNVTDAVPHSE